MPGKKPDLPVKACAVCGRTFAWRRKWARDWHEVRYCSERCRRARSGAGRSGPLRGLIAGALLLVILAPPLAAGEAEAEAAMDRMIESQAAVLDRLEEIEDAEDLERHRLALMAALAKARRDTDAVAGHAEAFGGSEGLRAGLADRIRAYTLRRDAVYAGVLDRLDEDALDRLDEIFDAAE